MNKVAKAVIIRPAASTIHAVLRLNCEDFITGGKAGIVIDPATPAVGVAVMQLSKKRRAYSMH